MVANEIQESLPKLKRLQFLERSYEDAFYEVAKLVSKSNGSLEDAKDIFHDAIIILLKHRAEGKEIESEIAYLIGISRHLLLGRIKSERKMQSLDEFSHDLSIEERVELKSSKLLQFVLQAGKRCMDLLASVYMEKRSMKHVATEFGFKSEHSASVQKYKCLEKVRDTIKSKHLEYEDLFE
jgi:DNA-directed RNA polymerase specialized sigma24 family protein